MRERLAASVLPALAVGLAAGAAGGVWAAGALDTTPYGEVELNTVARRAHQEGSAAGRREAGEAAARQAADLRAANEEQVARLQEELRRTARALQRATDRAEAREAESDRLEASLAETTAALQNATTQPSDASDAQPVEGTVRSTWTLGPGARPWPQSCAPVLDTYGLRVAAGGGATVATGRLVGADTARRDVTGSRLELTCSLAYSVDLPTPLGPAYQFVLDAGGRTVQAEPAPGAALTDGKGPSLAVSR